MSSGGARIRSGPMKDPNSGQSKRKGYTLAALPSEGYKGKIPAFPLEDPTEEELECWTKTWRKPQGCAWILPSQNWRIPIVALWVRTFMRCQRPTARANLIAQLHRLGDQIGMTTAGLAEMGWTIEREGDGDKKEPKKKAISNSRARLKVVNS